MCIIAAFGLWLYISNVENPIDDYKLTNVAVKLINVEGLNNSKMALLPGNHPTVTLTLRCKNSDFSMVKPEQFSLVADLSAYVVRKGENNIPVKIVSSPNPDNIKIVNSDNLWVKVNLDDYVEKSVPLKLNMSDVKQGYYALKPQLKMTEVLVSGAAKYVNMVSSVIAKSDLKNYTKDTTLNLPLQAVNADSNTVINEVKLNPESMEFTIPIKKVKSVGINIKTKGNVNKNIVLKALSSAPDKIDIAGDENTIKNIAALDTETIDLDKLQQSGSANAKLVIPDGISLVNSDGTVKVTASMDKNIQKNMDVDITVKNASDAYNYTLSVTKVNMDISGYESVINNLKPGDISCSVDLSNLAEGEFNLPLNITLPDGVTKTKSAPDTVKAVLKKKG